MLRRQLSTVSRYSFKVLQLRQLSTTDSFSTIIDPHCDPSLPLKLNFAQISSAAYNIKSGIQRTECRRSFKLSHAVGSNVHLKMELNQATGSFKERGARQALLRLTDEQKKAGVWAASAGNHALALCYHGKKLGIPINVVMPRFAPLMKIDYCVKFGANVIVEGKDITVSRGIALKSAIEFGAVYINGYDHIDILAGAGTIGLELLDQVNDLDAVIIPVGGGGLIAGIGVAIKTLYPKIQIIGVESETCPSFTKSLEAGIPTITKCLPSLADGLAVPLVGVNAFYTAKECVDKMVQVNEQSIALAILRLIEWEKVCVEGAGATGIAALMSGQLPELKGKRVATILSGGNIDSTALGRCIDRGLVYDDRLIRFKVIVSDRPGGISELAKIIADTGASIKDMFMERAWANVFSVNVKVVAETRNKEHVEELEKLLRSRYEDVCFTQFEHYLVRH
uniref:Tryptophan synthase beta chain-like PALP domain-containing protein n=1 Tax=Panagrolaimus sp. ES5 TaxID=591445 RepID=A0AC34GXR5_9BILA